jgi:hypothetical protein
MEKRFLVALALVAALGLFIVSGSGCSGLIYGESSTVSRSPTTESEFRSYITLDCLSVQEALQDVVGAPPYEPSQAGFDAIRDWVADNIAYKSDQDRWGGDYWQTPEETLSYRTGDCEDFSILLCSLLRAYGIDAERVYVTLGVDGGEDGHAFLVEDWYYDGEWRRLESQAPARLSSYAWLGCLGSHPDSALDKYEITAVFNDLYYHEDGDESFSWGQDQGEASTINKIITTVGYIVRQLSRLTEYLLGLLFN